MNTEPMCSDGGCTYRVVRYSMITKPLLVHCCHCRWCQRESGPQGGIAGPVTAAIAVNNRGYVKLSLADPLI